MATEMLLEGQRVIPQKLMDSGFSFRDTQLQDALPRILKRAA